MEDIYTSEEGEKVVKGKDKGFRENVQLIGDGNVRTSKGRGTGCRKTETG